MPSHTRAADGGVWFSRHPALAMCVALALYAAVFTARIGTRGADGEAEAITMLYALPIALLAFAFGGLGGIAAGGLAAVLVAIVAASDHVAIGVLGWIAWVAPLVLLGILVGGAADRIQHTAETERLLMAAELRQREAAEINDAVLQRLTCAKWALEAGAEQRTLELLGETMQTTQQLVADLLREVAVEPRRSRHVSGVTRAAS